MDDYDSVCLQIARDIALADSDSIDEETQNAARAYLRQAFNYEDETKPGSDLPEGERAHRFGPHDD